VNGFRGVDFVISGRAPSDPRATGKIQASQCLCNNCRFFADMVVETQIDSHLDLVTATLARPDMTDFVVAHVCRRLWRDQ
jgi:hypothetical protein